MFDIDMIKTRRSIRKFTSKQISKQHLDLILQTATYAPSGHNSQPWHFTVIQNRPLLNEISTKTKVLMTQSTLEKQAKTGANEKFHLFYNAPTVVIVSGDTKVKSPIQLPNTDVPSYSPLSDCCAAITTMLLAAHSINVSSCWIGYIQYYFTLPEAKQILQIPSGYQPLFAVCLGYQDNGSNTAPQRKTDVITYLC